MHTVSHHLLRRRARERAAKLNADLRVSPPTGVGNAPYRVVRSARGPWRWRVVR